MAEKIGRCQFGEWLDGSPSTSTTGTWEGYAGNGFNKRGFPRGLGTDNSDLREVDIDLDTVIDELLYKESKRFKYVPRAMQTIHEI